MNDLYNNWKKCGCPICKIAIFSFDFKKRIKTIGRKYQLDKN